jgi:hypothetical protein
VRPSARTLAIVSLLIVGAQAIRPARTNPPTDPSRTIEAQTQMTPEVKAILDRACRDCHTHDTVWPWYSQVAPISWIVISHVNEGREHLTLSDWASYDPARAVRKLDDMCEQVRSGEMPMTSYVWAHPAANVTDADVAALCAWTAREAAQSR